MKTQIKFSYLLHSERHADAIFFHQHSFCARRMKIEKRMLSKLSDVGINPDSQSFVQSKRRTQLHLIPCHPLQHQLMHWIESTTTNRRLGQGLQCCCWMGFYRLPPLHAFYHRTAFKWRKVIRKHIKVQRQRGFLFPLGSRTEMEGVPYALQIRPSSLKRAEFLKALPNVTHVSRSCVYSPGSTAQGCAAHTERASSSPESHAFKPDEWSTTIKRFRWEWSTSPLATVKTTVYIQRHFLLDSNNGAVFLFGFAQVLF